MCQAFESCPPNFSEKCYLVFFKKSPVASDAVPVNIFKGDYSNLKHLKIKQSK